MPPLTLPSPLVPTVWLAENLNRVRVIDASWHMPAEGRDAMAEFLAAHVPGAVFFDLDACSDRSSNLPHMLPEPGVFKAWMEASGIRNEEAVVVYDTAGLFSAARLWWMLRYFGHRNAAVLDGGLPKWQAEARPLAHGTPSQRERSDYLPAPDARLLKSKTDLLENLATGQAQVLDARGAARFSGSEPEPRKGLRAGHIPQSRNVHYASLLNTDKTMKSPEALRRLLQADGRPVISSCGSGVTACILDLALELTGHPEHAVYDGSWAEWGACPDCPVETGGA